MKNNQEGKRSREHELGMQGNITRRDFLNGVAVGAGGLVAGALFPNLLSAQGSQRFAQDIPGYYPPTLTGMRGSHPGAFELAHAERDDDSWQKAGKPTNERIYELVEFPRCQRLACAANGADTFTRKRQDLV